MIIWKILAFALLSAAAYAVISVALFRLFRERNAVVLGRIRWLLLGLVAAQAVLQLGLAACAWLGWGAAPGNTELAVAAGQILMAASLWPFLERVRTRLPREMGLRARLRLARADSVAARANTWLELAAGVAHFGQWRISPGDRAFDWSDEMFMIHGLKRAEFTPEMDRVILLFHTEDRKSVASNFAKIMTQGGNFEITVRLRRPDTELRHVLLRGTAQEDGALVGVLLDITERQVAEARMREANAVALQANAALKKMTTEDDLTGVANRRQFDLSLVHEFKRALRSSLPLGLVLIDLDNFKAYNELYGLAAGDACLRRVAQAIRAVPRRTGDLVARYGGEELAVLLPLADDAGATRVANVICEAVQALQITHEGSETGFLTISCGAAAFTGVADLSNPLELVRRADQAMFKAKIDGRDRVVTFEPSLNNDLRDPYGAPLSQDAARSIKNRA